MTVPTDLIAAFAACFLLLSASLSEAVNSTTGEAFRQCFLDRARCNASQVLICAPGDASYGALLRSSARDAMFLSSDATTKPAFIVTPTSPVHAQAAVSCGRCHGLRVRVRSGGHDFEGLYVSAGDPFVLLDLAEMRAVTVDVTGGTAWVEAGATIGEVYYNIGTKTKTAAFSAGFCPTVGVGGHFSGGGTSALMRKYGTAADNVVDALLVDADGDLMDREAMGEDLFWAIRGGGAASFGVILAYKIRLVEVPSKVTTFTISRTDLGTGRGATRLVEKWQHVAPRLDDNIFLRVQAAAATTDGAGGRDGNRTIQATFQCLYLGGRGQLLSALDDGFPELGVVAEDCREMSWAESVLFLAGYSNLSLDILLDRTAPGQEHVSWKAPSDFVREPIPLQGWERIWKALLDAPEQPLNMVMDPWGGRMDEIAEDAIAFPHRKGNMYNIMHYLAWDQTAATAATTRRHLSWVRAFYRSMAPYVSKNPRAAYLNYRDMDLGRHETAGEADYGRDGALGRAYFLNNYERLARVKARVDPDDYFWNEQSIPPYTPPAD